MATRSFQTEDNGGKAFRVSVQGDDVAKPDVVTITWLRTGQLVKTYVAPQHVFLGKSERCPMTKFSGGIGADFDDCAILIELGDCHYCYVGTDVYEFCSEAPIIHFSALMGNSRVIYSYGRDVNGRIYLTLNRFSYEPREGMLVEPPYEDPYVYNEWGDGPKKPQSKMFREVIEYVSTTEQRGIVFRPPRRTKSMWWKRWRPDCLSAE